MAPAVRTLGPPGSSRSNSISAWYEYAFCLARKSDIPRSRSAGTGVPATAGAFPCAPADSAIASANSETKIDAGMRRFMRTPDDWSVRLYAAGLLDLGDLLVDHLVVLAGGDLDLGAFGPGEESQHEASRIDRGDAHRDLLYHVRLLALQHADVARRSGAVDRHMLGVRLVLFVHHRAASGEAGDG